MEQACSEVDTAFRRVNLEILGNTDAFLHAHVWPRYEWEPSDLVHKPVWLYPAERWSDDETALGPQHEALRAAIASRLNAQSHRTAQGYPTGRPPQARRSGLGLGAVVVAAVWSGKVV